MAFTIWYRDKSGVVCSLDCDTIIYAQSAWDVLSTANHMLSTRP